MPNPDRLLTTLHRAATAFRSTPGRRGRVIYLEEATDVLASGDLHGNLANFRSLLDRAKLAENPGRHLLLQELVHGEFHYAGGGDKSHQLVDLLAALKCQFPRQVHMVLGNHELSQWMNRQIGKAEDDLNDQFRRGLQTAYGTRADEIYLVYLKLFAALPVAVRTANRVFLSHSLPSGARLATFDLARLELDDAEPSDLLPPGSIHSLVWGRDTSPDTAAAFLRKVNANLLVTGHMPCENGFLAPNDRQLILNSEGAPACYCLFPADRPLTHVELISCVKQL